MGTLRVEHLGLVVSPRHHATPRLLPEHVPLRLSPLAIGQSLLPVTPTPQPPSPTTHPLLPTSLPVFLTPRHLLAASRPSSPTSLPVSPVLFPVSPRVFLVSPTLHRVSQNPFQVLLTPQRGIPSSRQTTPTSAAQRNRKRSVAEVGDACSVRALVGVAAQGAISYNDVRNIRVVKMLGSGGFGTVYKGLMCGDHVAVKRLRTHTKNTHAQWESYRAELHLLTLSHPCLVAGLCAMPGGSGCDAVLVMEYVSDRNLLHVINDTSETLDMVRRLKYAHQLSKALAYIHSRNVVHLDVKPSNILVTRDDSVKLGDFGCSQVVFGEEDLALPARRSHLTGTAAFRAPELLRGEGASRKADIYALGITLWQLMEREEPYAGENPHVVIFGVVALNLRPERSHCAASDVMSDVASHVTKESGEEVDEVDGASTADVVEELYLEVVRQCWDANHSERPHAELLKEVFETWLWGY